MTPRERVLAALARRQPDRVPFSWGFGPTAEMAEVLKKYYSGKGVSWERLMEATGDIGAIDAPYIGPPLPPNTDPWGIHSKEVSYGSGSYAEFTGFPLAECETPEQVHTHAWPDPDHFDYASLPAQAARAGHDGRRAVRSRIMNPFEIYSWLAGLETAMVNLAVNREVVAAALEHITGFFEEYLRYTLEACGKQLDIVFFGDDLGSQQGLLVSRQAYCEVLQPYHRRLTGMVRRLAPHARTMFHSDGAVFDLLPDLADAGFDILEAVQTDAAGMEPERLKAAHGGRICFHGAISVQSLLPHGDAATVKRECRRLVEVLGKNGGYIAAPSHAIQMGTPPENVEAMLETVLGEYDHQKALQEARL